MGERHDLIIDQGADFGIEIDILDVNGDPDTTNYTATAMMRKNYTSSSAYSFTCIVSEGKLMLSMTAAETANIVAGRYVYDVDLYDPNTNTISRIVEGQVSVKPSVTR